MNNKRDVCKNPEKAIKQAIERISKPIFDKVLQETKKNLTLVGGVGQNRSKFCYYNPHNYRLYFDFSRVGFSLLKPTVGNKRGRWSVSNGNVKVVNKTEYIFKDFEGCNIRLRKNTIEILNKLDHKKNYLIKLNSRSEIEKQFKDIVNKKNSECINILKLFIKEFGGSSNFKLLNFYSDNKITHEKAIDMMPLKMKFNNQVVKKVYNEQNVEFSTPAGACNYLTNRGLEDYNSIIADRLKAIEKKLSGKVEVKEKLVKVSYDVGLKTKEGKVLSEDIEQEFNSEGYNRVFFWGLVR